MYSEAFQTLMVQKMTSPDRVDVAALVEETGVSRSTLYRWADEAGKLTQLDVENPIKTDPLQRPCRMKRPQDWSAKEKLAAVLEAAALSDEELGAFLRRKGLHEAQLQQWQEQMLSGLTPVPAQRGKKAPETKRVRELEKELRRKDKALAETAALLVLKKKAQAIWGDGDDDTES